MEAVIYMTETGSSERYAKMTAHETGLPVYSLKQAKNKVREGADVIYFGNINAGKINGYSKASKRYNIRAVCAVGMGQTGTQTDVVRKSTKIPANIPLFTLQGNFDVKKLRGLNRIMMEIMVKTVGKALASKENRTPEEDDMLDMMLNGGERVKFDNLKAVLDWYGLFSE